MLAIAAGTSAGLVLASVKLKMAIVIKISYQHVHKMALCIATYSATNISVWQKQELILRRWKNLYYYKRCIDTIDTTHVIDKLVALYIGIICRTNKLLTMMFQLTVI